MLIKSVALDFKLTVTLIVDGYWSAPGVPIPATGNYLSAGYTILTPVARTFLYVSLYDHHLTRKIGGNIKLTSASPFATPVIDGQFLNNDFDMEVMRTGFKNLSTFINTGLKSLSPKPFGAQVGVSTDAQIDQYNRNGA